MQKTTYIRFLADGTVQWRVEGLDGGVRAGEGALEEAAGYAQSGRVIVFVPGSDALVKRVNVPTRQAQKLRRAVPFALEDQLAQDVDELHFALGQPLDDATVPVVVVSRACMERWHQALEEAEVRPGLMVPDMLAIPFEEGTWALLLEERGAQLRTEREFGVAMDREEAPALLELALEGSEPPLAGITVIDARRDRSTPPDLGPVEGTELRVQPVGSPLEALSQGVGSGAINLLQGSYSRQEQYGRLWRPWRLAVALLGGLIVLQGGMGLAHYRELRSADEQLYRQVEQTYREAFPDAKSIVNPRVQMERKLEELRGGGGEGGVIALLAAAGPLLKGEGIDIRALRFRDGGLELDLELKDLPSLDGLKQRLSAQGLGVEIQTASTRGNKVESRLAIRGAGA